MANGLYFSRPDLDDSSFISESKYILGKAMLQNATFMKVGICIALIFRKTDVLTTKFFMSEGPGCFEIAWDKFSWRYRVKKRENFESGKFLFSCFWGFFPENNKN